MLLRRRKGREQLTESLSSVVVAHLHDGDASARHRITQLPFVQEQFYVKSIKHVHKVNKQTEQTTSVSFYDLILHARTQLRKFEIFYVLIMTSLPHC